MIGKTLGHYRILDQLGAGGMGEVYRAEDTTLRREVALKVLPAELSADPQSLARFKREARSLAALDHPNIVSIHSVEESDGIQFLTMQLVEGETLSKVISEGDLSVERILDIVIDLTDALASAHEKGIIHRDLKPANVMVTDEGRVKVLDFGLAKPRQEAQAPVVTQMSTELMAETEQLTRQGMVLGTVPYMSPEQVQGRPVDHRTDIFSFGIVLYEMACGKRPFGGENSATLISSILRDEPEPVAELSPGLPQRLVDTIEKCLEKNPEERFPTTRELHAELVGLRGEVTAGQAEVSWARSKAARLGVGARVLLAAALILVIVAGVVWFSSQGPGESTEVATQGPQIRSLAVLPMRNLSGDPEQDYFVDGMTEALITDLSKISALKVISRSSAMRYKNTDKSLSEIARELDVEALIEGSVLREEDRVRVTAQLIEATTESNLWADRYERNLTSILALQSEVAQAIAREIQVTLTPGEEILLTRARQVNPEAYEAYLKGQFHVYKLTPADLETALQYFELALEKDPDYAPAQTGIALVWAGRGQMGWVSPHEAGPKTRVAVQRALELDETLAEAHYTLALMRTWMDWDWEGAETAFRRAIELDPNFADVRAYYSHFLMIMKRPDEAMAQMESALELDPFNALLQALYGVVLQSSHRFDEAIDVCRNILRTVPNHPMALGCLVQAFYHKGMYEESFEAAKAEHTAMGEPRAVKALDRGYAEGGFTGAMTRRAEWWVANWPAPFGASSYIKAGKNQEALNTLELGFEEHNPNMPYISVDPHYDSLRNEPRFQDLLRRMNLPE